MATDGVFQPRSPAVNGHWSEVGSEDGCAIDERRVGEHAKDSFCRFENGSWTGCGMEVCFSMYALHVTRLDYRLGQSWSPLQAADDGASCFHGWRHGQSKTRS
jgi:hypothetical protein